MLTKIKAAYFYLVLGFINKFLSGTRFFKLKRILLNKIGIRVGKETKVVGPIKIGRVAELEIGDRCWIGTNLIIHGNGKVKIGNNCDIAPDVTLLTGSHEIGDFTRRAGKGISFLIIVDSNTWIGASSTLIGNIKVGKGCIIGACSLVNKSFDNDIILGGIPAKVIKSLV